MILVPVLLPGIWCTLVLQMASELNASAEQLESSYREGMARMSAECKAAERRLETNAEEIRDMGRDLVATLKVGGVEPGPLARASLSCWGPLAQPLLQHVWPCSSSLAHSFFPLGLLGALGIAEAQGHVLKAINTFWPAAQTISPLCSSGPLGNAGAPGGGDPEGHRVSAEHGIDEQHKGMIRSGATDDGVAGAKTVVDVA